MISEMPISIGRHIVRSILAVLLLSCITGCATKTESRWIISESVYYSDEQLEALYTEHKDDFHEIVDIVLASDSFLDRIVESKEGDGDISFKADRQYFTKEDWKKIEAFFAEIKPYMIMRSIQYGEDIVYFTFSSKITGDHQVFTTLYHITTQRAREACERSEDTFVEIDENWWIGTSTYRKPSLFL